jgi:peptide/nickel transport system substrate-binding protein
MKPLEIVKKSILPILFVTVMLIATMGAAHAQVQGPRYGGTMVYAENTSDKGIVIGFWANAENRFVGTEVFNGLLHYDSSYTPGPELATSWENSADNMQTTFHLRSDVKWHDGQPFNSTDVKFTYEEIGQLSGEGKLYFSKGVDLDHVGTPDKNTAVFYWVYPHGLSSPAFSNLGVFAIPIAPTHLYKWGDKNDYINSQYNIKPIGTGPYKFLEWISGDHISLVRNENYWNKDQSGNKLPYLDKLVIRFIPDTATLLAAMKAGEIDFLPSGYPINLLADLNKDPNFAPVHVGATAMGYVVRMMMNLDSGPTTNVKVRQAINLAINRQEIIDKVVSGGGSPSTGIFAGDGLKKYRSPKVGGAPKYDTASAEKLLDDAGYPRKADGTRLTIDRFVVTNGAPEYNADLANLVRDQLKQVGITVNIVVTDQGTLNNWVWVSRPRKYDIATQLSRAGPDPIFSRKRYDSHFIAPISRQNWGYNNSQNDQLWFQATRETDAAKLTGVFNQIDEILNRDLPEVYVYDYFRAQPLRNTFHGTVNYFTNPEAGPMDQVWWEKGTLITPATASTTATAAKPPTGGIDTTTIGAIVVLIVVVAGAAVYMSKRKKTPAK